MTDRHHDHEHAGPHVAQSDHQRGDQPSRLELLLAAHAASVAIEQPAATFDIVFLEAPHVDVDLDEEDQP